MSTDICPDCKVGTLTAYKTTPRSTGLAERNRACKCCGYRDVVLIRPAEVIKRLRIVRTSQGIDQPVTDALGIPISNNETEN